MTMQEIATIAGVHKSTVDKVVHNRPGVSQAVRDRIQALLKECNYQPNRAAQALSYSKSEFKIGVILVNVDAQEFLLEGIRKALNEYSEYNIRIDCASVDMWDHQKMSDQIMEMAEKNVEGLLISPVNSKRVREALQIISGRGIPVITLNSDITGTDRLCFVGQDGKKASFAAARFMAEMLQEKGKTAIITSAIAEENNNYYVKIREESYISYMKEHFPEITITDIVESMEDKDVTRKKTRLLLDKEPDLRGIYITCGGVPEVVDTVRKAGKTGQIKILGFEAYPQIIQLMREDAITMTIDGDICGQGYKAAQSLLEYLINKKKPVSDQIFLDSRILIKELLD